jgi:nicotinamide mononucleotide transporter
MLFFDIVGALLSLAAVCLFTRTNRLAWPVCLGANVINGVLYLNSGIYGHTALEVGYVLLNGYGWYYWKTHTSALISSTSHQEFVCMAVTLLGSYPCVYYALSLTDSTIPGLDAFTTVVDVHAAWLMCRGRIESWLLWFLSDCIHALVYFYKQIPFHFMLMLIYLVLAVIGYRRWQLQLKPSLERSI